MRLSFLFLLFFFALSTMRAGTKNAMRAGTENAMRAGTENAMRAGTENAMRAGTENAMRAGTENAMRAGTGPAPTVNIWEGTACHKLVELTPYIATGGQPDAVDFPERVSAGGHKGIIVCPGGSYFWHDLETEGHNVARWLQGHGIVAFVLRYRTAYVPAFLLHHRLLFRGNRYPDALDDLRQALLHIRTNADLYGVCADSIGVMGFSAGGHLAMLSAEQLPVAERPAFVVPVYPVVTMAPPFCHRRSRRGLLGDSRTGDAQLCDLLSLERHVTKDCPPVFLVNCKDDPVVDYHNSVLLDSALSAQGVPHRYLQYATGGHGFGASDTKGTVECRQWRQAFLDWLALPMSPHNPY